VTNRPPRVIRALTRAQRPREAGKRWKPKVGTAAKRGDLFVFTMQVPYVVPQGDKVRRRSEYALAIVTTVTREGRVTSYRLVGSVDIEKSTPSRILLVSAALLDVGELEKAYVARGDAEARTFRTVNKARDFIRPHVRQTPSPRK
jgi:hypothetical protein